MDPSTNTFVLRDRLKLSLRWLAVETYTCDVKIFSGLLAVTGNTRAHRNLARLGAGCKSPSSRVDHTASPGNQLADCDRSERVLGRCCRHVGDLEVTSILFKSIQYPLVLLLFFFPPRPL